MFFFILKINKEAAYKFTYFYFLECRINVESIKLRNRTKTPTKYIFKMFSYNDFYAQFHNIPFPQIQKKKETVESILWILFLYYNSNQS